MSDATKLMIFLPFRAGPHRTTNCRGSKTGGHCYGFTIFCYEYNYLDNNNGGLSMESNNN